MSGAYAFTFAISVALWTAALCIDLPRLGLR